MKRTGLLVLLLNSGVLLAGLLTQEKVGSYESKGQYYAVGETIQLLAPRDKAELAAIKDAIARVSALLEKKGLGAKKELAEGIENSVTKETALTAFKLGKVKIESVYQERWNAPDGKEAWSVKVKISIRRR